jgi:apolipoprotein D and lipocalin family protein
MRRAFLLLGTIAASGVASALTPVADFDLSRYFGTWYEIAAMPGFLQSKCARDTRSVYTAADNGAIAVQSLCQRMDGTPESSEARSRPLDSAMPAVLKVTTVNLFGIWWYPFGRESIVLAVGPNYRWLVVGHPSLRYGRILSREPALSKDALRSAAAALAAQEFDTCAFVTTPQTGGLERAGRLCDLLQQ